MDFIFIVIWYFKNKMHVCLYNEHDMLLVLLIKPQMFMFTVHWLVKHYFKYILVNVEL